MAMPPSSFIVRNETAGTPLIGIVADSGQLTKVAVAAGVDFLLVLSAGFYRNQGSSPLAVHLPFQNSNDLAERLLHEQVLPRAGATPTILGLMPGDPTVPLEERLDRLKPFR